MNVFCVVCDEELALDVADQIENMPAYCEECFAALGSLGIVDRQGWGL